MELMTDWKSYQQIFCQQFLEKLPFVVVTEKNCIFDVCSQNEKDRDWIGQNTDLFKQEKGHEKKKWIFIEKKNFYDGFKSVWNHPNLFCQSDLFLNKMFFSQKNPIQKHFLFDFLKSWGWFLPSQFGVYICLTEKKEEQKEGILNHLFLIFQRGQLVQFYSPEIAQNILTQKTAFVRSLSHYHFLPVTGCFFDYHDWKKWSHQDQPWRSLFFSLGKNRKQIVSLGPVKLFALAFMALKR
jgi:hypothetical protein